MSTFRSLRDAALAGKKVLLRAGFDVPMEQGVVTDTSRIEAVIPTMTYILSQGAALIIMAHQDRPKGKVVPEMSQRPLVPILAQLLGREVLFAPSCVGSETKEMVDALTPGQVLLLENLRFDAREEANDEGFGAELASYADVYVNDAFSNAHRAHASMVTVAKNLPAYMGLQLEQEVHHLSAITLNPPRPLTLIISGAKIETKLPVIQFFLHKGDNILLGGAIANTFMAATGAQVGQSLYEKESIPLAQDLLARHGDGVFARIHVPTDCVVAQDAVGSGARTLALRDYEGEGAVYDVGTQTTEAYIAIINQSAAVVWNGPLGLYETEAFATSSKRIAQALRDAAKRGVTVVVGGGDTIDCHIKYGLPLTDYTFVSTGGGAMLDFVSGKELPALQPLRTES